MEIIAKPIFRMNADYDICLLPFSPVTEKDELEIRVQVFNSGTEGDVEISFYLDDRLLDKCSLTIKKDSCGFAHTFAELAGQCGEHTVTVKLSCSEGEIDCKEGEYKKWAGIYREGEFLCCEAVLPLTVQKELKPVLNGGFVMLGPPNDRKPCDTYRDDLKSFTDEDWENYVTQMNDIGQSCIIIMVSQQYLTLESRKLVSHYPSKLVDKSDIAANDPIKAILNAAERNGQKVFVGVGNQFGHKGTIEEMTELYHTYKHFKSFYGWYFATELRMDKGDEAELEKWNLYNYLCEHAHTLCPVKPILISPMGMPCEEFAEYFKNIYFCDIIMPQDWVGQCAFHIEDSEEMHKKLHQICRSIHKHLWANCEGFNFTDTPDGKWENWGCTFKDFPWDAPRVLVPRFRGGGMVGEQGFDKQIKAAHPYVEKIMTFMLSGFFCPPGFTPVCGGEAAVKQYEEYVKYMNSVNE